MKIFFLTWKSFGNDDVIDAFRREGHEVVEFAYSDKEEPDDAQAVAKVTGEIRQAAVDCVFSFNYFPVVALACKELGMPYLSWIYDSPYVRIYHYSIAYPTNHVFVFDSSIYLEFHNAGIQTVHFLPMAANTERLSAMRDFGMFRRTGWYNAHEVAFIGSLYTEAHNFYDRLTGIKDYTRGYLEGLMAAQKQVYGYNFVQETLKAHPELIEDMRQFLPMTPGHDSVESVEYLFAQYVINRQITAMERKELLGEVAERFGLDLYTPDQDFRMKGCTNHGKVDYYDMAPYVFKTAKINLNISLRSILAGMPLRAFDVMGAGGFLLTNFQPDFLEFFVPGEDYVYFESKADLLDKVAYYLAHEEERKQIAENGFRKMEEQHTYRHRVREMLSCL
ncbi:MAG: glycosyltransferase [Lachnospiraceae bacterium]|nr:glycosyltransferase [Lachnospiraceae bacterium]